MYSLETLQHPLCKNLQYAKLVRSFEKIHYEEHTLERPYIGDQLDYDIRNWHCGRAIVIKAPVGSGKSYTVNKKIIPYAIKHGKNILIVTNRSPLNVSYKKDIAKTVGKGGCYTDEGLQQACEFDNVFIVNYQGLESFIANHRHIAFSYVICDECHYFLQDAGFTDCTGFALNSIPKEYPGAVRIYISATIKEVLPYITRAELYNCTVDEYGNCFRIENNRKYCLNSHIPVVYNMDSDYSRVNLEFFESTENLADFLERQPSKVLAFCDSKKECSDFAELMGGGLVINSEFLHENPDVLNRLVKKESFEEKCMCSTTVFSNGNNICDNSVKSVVITLTDPTEIVQMAGRRRLNYSDENDNFTLYIKIPDIGHVVKKIHRIRTLNDEIDKCKQNYAHLLDIIKDGNDDIAKKIRAIFKVNRQTLKYEINYLCEEKLYLDLYHLEFIYTLLTELGKEAYCEWISRLFDKAFEYNMIFVSLKSKKEELKNFISEYGFPLNKSEFKEFCDDFLRERIRLFGSNKADNLSSSRKTPAIRSINNRLKEYKLGIEIIRNDDQYYIKTLIEGGDVQ